MSKQTVNIHGKEYETVASRVSRFKEAYPDHRIVTNLIDRNEESVVMKASIRDKEGNTIATGHAEENRQASTINKTSALENCETSAIGRALAAFGIGGTEFASADEVAQAIHEQNSPDQRATPKQKVIISNNLAKIGVSLEQQEGYLIEQFGVEVPLTKEGASFVISQLIEQERLARR